jgi:hypothetical protein
MMVRLNMPLKMHTDIWAHLLPNPALTEEAGFGFAHYSAKDKCNHFSLLEWIPLVDADFVFKEGDYLQLNDEARGRVIKHAHDTGTCLVEFHSHPSPYPAKFSYADKDGLDQFVPHVWWRLKHRPYLSVVVAPDNFDGIAWIESFDMPVSLNSISNGQGLITSTGLSIDLWGQ